MIGKTFRDRLPNSHGCAGDHHNFSCKFHSALLLLSNLLSQALGYNQDQSDQVSYGSPRTEIARLP